MWAHQFAEALHTSDSLGLERFATMQNHYNLAYREEEREMLPLCERESIGVMPWSPLARGFLARPHDEYLSTTRAETDDYAQAHPYADNGGREINERVQEHKEVRNELNAKANELFEEVDRLKSDLKLDEGKDLEQLEDEIEDLEFKQQTEVLSTEDERELIEKIEEKRSPRKLYTEMLLRRGDIEPDEAEETTERLADLYDRPERYTTLPNELSRVQAFVRGVSRRAGGDLASSRTGS